MKKLAFILLSASMLAVLSGCMRGDKSSQYMTFDTVEYVEEFPYVEELTDMETLDIDLIGINDFCIVDSVMIFSQRGNKWLWSMFSLPGRKLIGSCFTKGTGPGEFIESPRVSHKTDFFREDGRLYASIYEFQTGKVVKSDIVASLEQHKNVMTVLCDDLPQNLFNFISISDSLFFCKEVSSDFTRQQRYLAGKSACELPAAIQHLNEAKVGGMDGINIISTITKMNHDNGMMVEMPIGLNYINMYSLDGSFTKTVCIGAKLDDISNIEDQKQWNRLYTFADVRLFDRFWGVVSIQEDNMTFQKGRKKYPSILLFDWEGRPVAELKLTRFVTSFDIDMTNKILYTFDVHEDQMYVCDISNALTKVGI